jgi:hypothetical protein
MSCVRPATPSIPSKEFALFQAVTEAVQQLIVTTSLPVPDPGISQSLLFGFDFVCSRFGLCESVLSLLKEDASQEGTLTCLSDGDGGVRGRLWPPAAVVLAKGGLFGVALLDMMLLATLSGYFVRGWDLVLWTSRLRTRGHHTKHFARVIYLLRPSPRLPEAVRSTGSLSEATSTFIPRARSLASEDLPSNSHTPLMILTSVGPVNCRYMSASRHIYNGPGV